MKTQLPEETLQVVIVRKDSNLTTAGLALNVSRASIELRDKYDPTHKDYVGRYEEDFFKKVMNQWIEEGRTQEYYEVDDFNDLLEIAFQCSMESVPSSFITKEEQDKVHCLVLGPFDKYRLEDLVQYAKYIPV